MKATSDVTSSLEGDNPKDTLEHFGECYQDVAVDDDGVGVGVVAVVVVEAVAVDEAVDELAFAAESGRVGVVVVVAVARSRLPWKVGTVAHWKATV